MKRFTLLLLTVFLVFSLFACSPGTGEAETTDATTTDEVTEVFDDTTDDVLKLIDGSATDYRIIRGDTAQDWEIKGSSDFLTRFSKLTGVSPSIDTDWVKNGKTEREIIIGKTNREGDDFTIERDKLGRGGYIIKVCDERLVIIAHDTAGMQAALDRFFSLFDEKDVKKEMTIERTLDIMFEKLESQKDRDVLNYDNVKAMWLSQFDLQSVYCSSGQRSESEFRKYLSKILDNLVSIDINTIIVQVRPNADSMYPSKYYCPSAYVVGSYGGNFKYDPFEIVIEEAHARNLSVHAWINPMRAMTTAEIEKTSSEYQLTKWWNDGSVKNKYLPVVSNRVYLNVAYPEVRQLIIDGAKEILENYEVDGLHMDDYFYPTTAESFDSAAYSELGRGKNLADWRRGNINTLVADLYSMVKSVNENIKFGISPAGNMSNDYNSLYADIYTWCGKAGYIDYICPQIYFGMEHQTCAFESLSGKWNDITTADGVEMWLGMTVGKAVNGSKGVGDQYAGSGKEEWIHNKDVLKRCLETTVKFSRCTGVSYFCYQYFWDPVSGAENNYSATERANFLPVLKTISWN